MLTRYNIIINYKKQLQFLCFKTAIQKSFFPSLDDNDFSYFKKNLTIASNSSFHLRFLHDTLNKRHRERSYPPMLKNSTEAVHLQTKISKDSDLKNRDY